MTVAQNSEWNTSPRGGNCWNTLGTWSLLLNLCVSADASEQRLHALKLSWISVKENNHLDFILQRKVDSINIPVINQGRKNFPVLRCGSCLHIKSWQKRFSSMALYLATTLPRWLVTSENLFLPSFAMLRTINVAKHCSPYFFCSQNHLQGTTQRHRIVFTWEEEMLCQETKHFFSFTEKM